LYASDYLTGEVEEELLDRLKKAVHAKTVNSLPEIHEHMAQVSDYLLLLESLSLMPSKWRADISTQDDDEAEMDTATMETWSMGQCWRSAVTSIHSLASPYSPTEKIKNEENTLYCLHELLDLLNEFKSVARSDIAKKKNCRFFYQSQSDSDLRKKKKLKKVKTDDRYCKLCFEAFNGEDEHTAQDMNGPGSASMVDDNDDDEEEDDENNEENLNDKLYHNPTVLSGCRKARKIYECSPWCCGNQCGSKLVEKGPQPPLEVHWVADGVGFGVRSPIALPINTYICEYAGEVIDLKTEGANREAIYQAEGRDQYILPLGDRSSHLAIDATVKGNIARFFNHSCEPNLNKVEVYSDHGDKRHFRIGFYTSRDIAANEELRWSYGTSSSPTDLKCRCGTANCKGYLPS
jgi:SET domain-containing protein